jgi:hypothetical protein
MRKNITLKEKPYQIKKKEEKFFKVDSFNSFLELLLKVYPFFLGFLILLDIDVFINAFGFDIGLITLIFSDISLVSFNLIIIILLIPFILSTYLIFGALSTYYIPKKLRKTKKLQKYYFDLSLIKKSFIIIVTHTLFYSIVISLLNIENKNIFIIYLLVIGLLFGYVTITKIYKVEEWKGYFSELLSVLPLFCIGVYYYYSFENGNILTLHILMSLFIIIIIMFSLNLEKEFDKKNDKNYKPSKLRVFITITFVVTAIYIGLTLINNDSWSKKINEKNIGINYTTINLLFNKGLLLKNKTMFNIPLSKEFYDDEIRKLYPEGVCCQKDDIGNCNVQYTVSNEYWYLPISKNIKLFVNYLDESKEQVFILIEEKKFANKKGSENILIDMKIK